MEKRIKVEAKICRKQAVFLDVRLDIENNEVTTGLYVKPSDRTSYLHAGSDHPSHMKGAIARGQMKRIRRICSKENEYEQEAERIKMKLIERGHNKRRIETAIRA